MTVAQIIIPDLPKLPEGSAVDSPVTTPPPPIEKDSVRSNSSSRPPPPPKERNRRSSTLHVVTSHEDMLSPSNRLSKPRTTRRRQIPIVNQLSSLKHWLVESARRARSPGKPPSSSPLNPMTGKTTPNLDKRQSALTPTDLRPKSHQTVDKISSTAQSSTPTSAHFIVAASRNPSLRQSARPLNTQMSNHYHRNSLSPSPLTPRSSQYRRPSTQGLRGRKSTSSSVSSIRSIHHRHSHSKASSTSSNSIDTTSTPSAVKSSSRSPHASIKILPATPTTGTSIPSNVRVVRAPSAALFDAGAGTKAGYNEAIPTDGPAPRLASPSAGLVFARRKKSPFRGPSINTGGLYGVAGGQGTPTLGKELGRSASGRSRRASRKSQIIEEDEEEEDEEPEVEEVEAFSPVDVGKGERVHSITMWNDGSRPGTATGTAASDDQENRGPGETVQGKGHEIDEEE